MTGASLHPDPSSIRGAKWLFVPTSVWAYGLVRSLAFVSPTWSEGGRIGLGLVVTLVLYVAVLASSAKAWHALVVIDTISLVFVLGQVATTGDVAYAVPLLTCGALVCLLLPGTRRHVGIGAHLALDTHG